MTPLTMRLQPAQGRVRRLAAHLSPGRRPQPPGAASPAATAATTLQPEPEPAVAGEMDAKQKFMLDLQGFLTIPDFLSPAEVQRLNAAFDANWERRTDCHQTPSYDEFNGMCEWPHPHCLPFRELIAHPKLFPILNTMYGPGARMDHMPTMFTGDRHTAARKGLPPSEPGGGGGHGFGGPFFNGEAYYRYANDQMRCGTAVFQYQLTDVKSGDGGLGVVPGAPPPPTTQRHNPTHTRVRGLLPAS